MFTPRLANLGWLLSTVGIVGWVLAFAALQAMDEPDPANVWVAALGLLLWLLPVLALLGVFALIVGAAIADHGELAHAVPESRSSSPVVESPRK